jgi:predicted 2-oxoglutarate/Fe(II)-dependent dioxygenase YbiX
VTINVCLLAEDCDGGELYFGGDQEGRNGFGYLHQQGRAIMHRGRNLHCVLPLNCGHRINMVMWLRSSSVRNKICPMCSKPPDLETVPDGWGDGFTLKSST